MSTFNKRGLLRILINDYLEIKEGGSPDEINEIYPMTYVFYIYIIDAAQ